MPRKITDKACKDIIRTIGNKLGVDPKFIALRLLDENDKDDMRNGELSMSLLEAHVKAWIQKGMPDYAHGCTEPLVSS